MAYIREQHEPPTWFYFDWSDVVPEPFYTNKTSLYLGFRADLESGRHFGWMHFTRSDTKFTNFFHLDEWNWNPLPDQPIKAGLPPEIPLSTAVVEEGGQPVLRLSWPAAVANWTLETATNLVPPIQWEDYPTGGASVDVPLGDSAEPERYFRLRQP